MSNNFTGGNDSIFISQQQIINQQILVRLIETIPKIFNANVTWSYFSLKFTFALLGSIELRQQSGKIVAHYPKQRWTHTGKNNPLPLTNGS